MSSLPGEVPESAVTIPEGRPILTANSLVKRFGDATVLDQVSFSLLPGEVHALVGENGAGKSTLVKILSGAHVRDGGIVELDGEPVELATPAAAHELGIATIYQEPAMFPDLTVAEQIFVGWYPVRGGLRQVDRARMRALATELLRRLDASIDVERRMRTVSIADQQLIEIAAALARDARILIMDESTSALTPHEVERLFAVVRRLRDDGHGIILITHRLEEVAALADRVTVLRDGRYVATSGAAEVSAEQLVAQMVGREIEVLHHHVPTVRAELRLEVKGLTRHGEFHDVTFDVHSGEILGLAGLVGAGRTEVAETLFGLRKADGGVAMVDGRRLDHSRPGAAIKAGVAYLPEDRARHGLVVPASVAANTSLTILRRIARQGVLQPRRERRTVERALAPLNIKARSRRQVAGQLSGGNQQKIALAKWLVRNPAVLIVDEPSRGVDIETKIEIRRLLDGLASRGVAIVLISSDLSELLGTSDRIVVLREGRVTAEIDRAVASEERVMSAAVIGG